MEPGQQCLEDLIKQVSVQNFLLLNYLPIHPGDFAEKCVFELVELFSGHCLLLRAKTYHKVLYRSYTSWPSDLDTKY